MTSAANGAHVHASSRFHMRYQTLNRLATNMSSLPFLQCVPPILCPIQEDPYISLTESAVYKLTNMSSGTPSSQKKKGKLSSLMPSLKVPKIHPFGKDKDADAKSEVGLKTLLPLHLVTREGVTMVSMVTLWHGGPTGLAHTGHSSVQL